jgi:hypothetical protein
MLNIDFANFAGALTDILSMKVGVLRIAGTGAAVVGCPTIIPVFALIVLSTPLLSASFLNMGLFKILLIDIKAPMPVYFGCSLGKLRMLLYQYQQLVLVD